jgi:hypothetical protein
MSHPLEHFERTLFFHGTKTCHPPVTLLTLQNRVQAQYLSAFCHPDTLKHKNPIRRWLVTTKAFRVAKRTLYFFFMNKTQYKVKKNVYFK